MSAAVAVAYAPVRERKISDSDKLIRTICLEVQPMTREIFAPYGEIISERGQIEIDLDGGQAGFVAQTVEKRPMIFDFLGRHRRTEQVFSPLGGTKSIIAVAMPTEDDTPDQNKMAAFLVDGTCAFKLHRGTWHTSAFPLQESASFLVVDREGTLDEDYDLRDLKTALGVVVEIRP
ncbi:MAG: ureidoglycolate lyase [Acidobacteria bacterium]|nr:ureidoglycolate lyase [Acidobacteriota bacterium]